MKQFIVLIILSLSTTFTKAANITVCPTCEIQTIKAAVAKAKKGDKIIVQSGTYRERGIVIETPLSIEGIGRPVLDGENKGEILTIKASNVNISGMKITHCGIASMDDWAGIGINNATNVRIFDNELVDNFFAMHFAHSNHCWVYNNVIYSNAAIEQNAGNGIHFWQCDSMNVHDNQVSGHRDGIYFEFVTNSTIERNLSHDNIRYGLHFMFSHDNHYLNNTFQRNGAGVAVMYSKGVTMLNNTFEDNRGEASYGLLLKDIRDSHIENNHFLRNSMGVYMEGASRNVLKHNVFDENGWAIRLQSSCDENVFSENNFSKNTFDMATNGSLVLNKLEKNYWDKYDGYDLDKNGIGDVPFHPLSIFSTITEQMPFAMMLWRSFAVILLDQAERIMPSLTPENLRDDMPKMKPYL